MPLTTRGICIQILSSLWAHHDFREMSSTNDCKVVVSHLVRKFSEPLQRAEKQQRLVSRTVHDGALDDTVDDHAVPVIVLVEKLLGMEPKYKQVTEANANALEGMLRKSLVLVTVTVDQDRLLCGAGLQRCMPPGWEDQASPFHGDVLARYKVAGIELADANDRA